MNRRDIQGVLIMRIRQSQLIFFIVSIFAVAAVLEAQQDTTEVEHRQQWSPVPAVVTPGDVSGAPPSDAIVLFNGKNLDQWVSAQDGSPAKWYVGGGVMTVNKTPGVGNIQTERTFKDYQLHIEWKIPKNITGSGVLRGNSGVMLASTGPGNDGYELQILDSYKNPTYVNGQAGAMYLQSPPSSIIEGPPGNPLRSERTLECGLWRCPAPPRRAWPSPASRSASGRDRRALCPRSCRSTLCQGQ